MGNVERITGVCDTRGHIEHAVRVPLKNLPVLRSTFSGQDILPDLLQAHWVCREAFGPWELDAVWVEGAVVDQGHAASPARDGLLFGSDTVGAEGPVDQAPAWVRRTAQETRWVRPAGAAKELVATA